MPKLPEALLGKSSMLRENTPVEDWTKQYGLYVKREDLSCSGPPFSKARGVYAHLLSTPNKIIGVLDTAHSQAGWAVARACSILGKRCINFYPSFKANAGPHRTQLKARELGAELVSLPAGRSAILFHQAKKRIEALGGYMMPNALKLNESVEETAKEVGYLGIGKERFDYVIIPASSGTIAAGVIKGFITQNDSRPPLFIIHLGYSRSEDEVRKYLLEKSGLDPTLYSVKVKIVDEKYAYKDKARAGETPPWPCNEYYDLKAFRWWLRNRESFRIGRTLFWNIG